MTANNFRRRKGARNARRIRQRLQDRDGDRCRICHQYERIDDPFTIDHIKRQRDGGTDRLSNLRLVHASCNFERN